MSDVGGVGHREGRDSDEGVVVRLSSQARQMMAEQGETDAAPVRGVRAADESGPRDGAPADSEDKDVTVAVNSSQGNGNVAGGGGAKKLSDEDKQLVSRLAARDAAVHAHEAAHQAAARGLGGAASFTYETGPDGRRYAVGGEVPVSIRSGRTPQETIANAQVVRSAALAPADPSSQDMAVASQASQMEAEARQELTRTKAEGGDDRDTSSHAKVDGRVGDRDPVTGTNVPKRAPDERDPLAKDPAAQKGEETTTIDSERDPLLIFSTLKAERGMVNGHVHTSGTAGCSFCSRAAARYA